MTDKLTECPNCKGTGKIDIGLDKYNNHAYGRKQSLLPCSVCNGTGKCILNSTDAENATVGPMGLDELIEQLKVDNLESIPESEWHEGDDDWNNGYRSALRDVLSHRPNLEAGMHANYTVLTDDHKKNTDILTRLCKQVGVGNYSEIEEAIAGMHGVLRFRKMKNLNGYDLLKSNGDDFGINIWSTSEMTAKESTQKFANDLGIPAVFEEEPTDG